MKREVRQPDGDWMVAASSFFSGKNEVLVSICYLYNSPCMNFALLKSLDQLRLVIERCKDGAKLTLWREASLPIRGKLTVALLDTARLSIPETAESLCLFTDSGSESDPRLEGESWRVAKHMFSELKDRLGEQVAIGPWPAADGSITAIKGGVDGPR